MISTKDNLYKCLSSYLDSSVFEYVPATFIVQTNSKSYRMDLEKFRLIFNILADHSRTATRCPDHELTKSDSLPYLDSEQQYFEMKSDHIECINSKLKNLSLMTVSKSNKSK